MKDKAYEDSELVEVFVAPNELLATMVRDLLESEGIDATIRSDQIVWYDSIAKASRGYWGKVFVRSEDKERAKELVAEFLKLGESASAETGGEEGEDGEGEEGEEAESADDDAEVAKGENAKGDAEDEEGEDEEGSGV